MASQYYSHGYSPQKKITSMNSLLLSTRMGDMSPELQNAFHSLEKQIKAQRGVMEKIETTNQGSFTQDYEKLVQDLKDTMHTLNQGQEKISEAAKETHKLHSTVDILYAKRGNLHNSEFAHKYFAELQASIKQKAEAYTNLILSLYEDCENSSPAPPTLYSVLRLIDTQWIILMRLEDKLGGISDQIGQCQVTQTRLTPKKPPPSPTFNFMSPFAPSVGASPFSTPIASQATPVPTSSAYPFATPPPSPSAYTVAPSILSFTPQTVAKPNTFASFSSPLASTSAPTSFGVSPAQPQPSASFGISAGSLLGAPTLGTATPTTPNSGNYALPSTPVSPIPISFGSPTTASPFGTPAASSASSVYQVSPASFGFNSSSTPSSQQQLFNSPVSLASASPSSPQTFGNLFTNANQPSSSASSSRNDNNNNNNANTHVDRRARRAASNRDAWDSMFNK